MKMFHKIAAFIFKLNPHSLPSSRRHFSDSFTVRKFCSHPGHHETKLRSHDPKQEHDSHFVHWAETHGCGNHRSSIQRPVRHNPRLKGRCQSTCRGPLLPLLMFFYDLKYVCPNLGHTFLLRILRHSCW